VYTILSAKSIPSVPFLLFPPLGKDRAGRNASDGASVRKILKCSYKVYCRGDAAPVSDTAHTCRKRGKRVSHAGKPMKVRLVKMTRETNNFNMDAKGGIKQGQNVSLRATDPISIKQ